MGSHRQSGMIFTELLVTLCFFIGLFIGIQALLEGHKARTEKYKITQEGKYEFKKIPKRK